MKRLNSVTKWALLLPINALPFVLNIMFYENGAMNEILLVLPICAVLSYLNYKAFDNRAHYRHIQIFLAVGTLCSGGVATYLYYRNISGDFPTLLVGGLITLFIAAVIIEVTRKITENREGEQK